MIREAIEAIVSGRDLDSDEAATSMQEIMTGRASAAQIASFITALRIKGETVEEILGMARTMRRNSLKVSLTEDLVDTCGTGGDGLGTFNISTATALVVAAAGLKVAKHGNRAASSVCGSADVLEACGVRIDVGPQEVEKCIREIGIGFMFAPVFHPAMRFAADPRREIGIRTVFNILGPLTNPAAPRSQVLGVARPELGETMALVLDRLGCEHAFVVHGGDGADELTLNSGNQIWELKHHKVETFTLSPSDVGLEVQQPGVIKGGDADTNRSLMEAVLGGEPGPLSDAVAFNSGAALYVANKVSDVESGVRQAKEILATGEPWKKMVLFAEFSQGL
jgi:anthranilate phosphoribosyltransferase